MSPVPRSRTLPGLAGPRAAVIGLVAGCALLPVVLAGLAAGDAHVPPVAFVTAGIFCGVLIPKAAAELWPRREARVAPATATAEANGAGVSGGAGENRR